MIWERVLLCLASALLSGELPGFSGVTSGYESWAGIPAHPAVVNPVLGQDAESVMSLRGKWLFTETYSELSRHPDLCRMSQGTNGFWRADGKGGLLPPKQIDVPACWEAQGIGEAGCTSTPWVCSWDCNRIALRHKHLGVGWYGKLVRLPDAWNGRRIWLKLGGFGSQGLVWVNGRQVAWNDCYCGTYKYEITPFVKFGGAENYIAMQVVNCESSRKGEREHMNRWGGVTRDVELEATPRTFIDDVWVRGDFDLREALVKVEIEGGGDREDSAFSLRATVEGEVAEVPLSSSVSAYDLRLALRAFRPWSPEHPNLYTAQVELVASDGSVVYRRAERFGVRKIECRGKEFYLNGRPLYLRGYGDDSNYPETGVSPADREFHLRRLKVAKAAGFNAVRLHTHCENPEYFEAADEVGILVQPELPYYCSIPCGGGSFDPERDVTELYRHFRRYPSFAIYSMGNEGSFGPDLDRRLHRLVKAMDPDRLKINQDTNLPKLCPPDASDTSAAPCTPWTRNVALADRDRPCVAHEYLNLCVKQDSRRADRYAGVWMPPVSREDRAKWLAKFGLTHHWGDRLQDAQHLLQRHYQKVGVELARSDRHCDGYHFWTLVDVTVSVPQDMTSSAQGLFDAATFGPKVRGFTAEEFARFNSAEGIYAILSDTNVIHVAGEKVSVDFWFSHYGEHAYSETVFAWEVVAASDGRRFAGDSVTCRDVSLGPSRFVGTALFDAPDVVKPTKALVKAKMGAAENEWEIWFFPKRRARKPVAGLAAATDALFAKLSARYEGVLPPSRVSEAKVVVADADSSEANAAERRGQRVLAIGPVDGRPNVALGWWFMGDQVGTAIADHPALSGLPHEGYLSPILFRIMKRGRRLVPGLFDEKDMLVVGEGGSDCYVYLAKKESSLVTYGLDLFAPHPEAVSLLDGLVDWCVSIASSNVTCRVLRTNRR